MSILFCRISKFNGSEKDICNSHQRNDDFVGQQIPIHSVVAFGNAPEGKLDNKTEREPVPTSSASDSHSLFSPHYYIIGRPSWRSFLFH